MLLEKVSSGKSCTIHEKTSTLSENELESKYVKNRTIENKAQYEKQNNFCIKLYKKEREKFYSNVELH